MMTWWLCACRASTNDSIEEVRIEPALVADGEAQSEYQMPNLGSTTIPDDAYTKGDDHDTLNSKGASRPLQEPVVQEGNPTTPLSAEDLQSLGALGGHVPEPGGGDSVSVADVCVSSLGSPRTQAPNDVAKLKLEEAKIEQLKDATDNVRVWFRESLIRWRKLPVGDECDGEAFLDAASTIPKVYPSVFKLTYAVTFLTADFADNVKTARKTWPKGAKSMREAVRMEVKAEGSEEKLGKKYWKTCSVRLLWICRTMRMFDVIMEVLATTDETPATCGRTAVDRILTPYLSWTLKKIAEYIIGVCCWSTQAGCCEYVQVPAAEFKECLALLYPLVRGHADSLEQMLKAEIPNVYKKKC